MNRILFFPQEIECFCIEERREAYVLRLPLYDQRARHIRLVLLQGGLRNAAASNVPLLLKAGVVGQSMGTLRVGEEQEGALECYYTVEVRGNFTSACDISVLLAHPRPPVMARLIRDLSTMGVTRIVVYTSDLCEKSYLKASLWADVDNLALQGAMQATGLNTLPSLSTHYSLSQALSCIEKEEDAGKARHTRKVYFSHEAEKAFFPTLALAPKPAAQRWFFALGAERGLTAREEDLLSQRGFSPHVLCNTVLRCESAVSVAVGMCISAAL